MTREKSLLPNIVFLSILILNLVCGKQDRQDDIHLEVRVFQPTMSSTKLIVGDVIEGAFKRDIPYSDTVQSFCSYQTLIISKSYLYAQ